MSCIIDKDLVNAVDVILEYTERVLKAANLDPVDPGIMDALLQNKEAFLRLKILIEREKQFSAKMAQNGTIAGIKVSPEMNNLLTELHEQVTMKKLQVLTRAAARCYKNYKKTLQKASNIAGE